MYLTDQIEALFFSEKGWYLHTTVLVALLLTLLLKVGIKLACRWLRKAKLFKKSRWGDVGIDIFAGLKSPIIFVWLFFLFSKAKNITLGYEKIMLTAVVAASIFQIGLWGMHIIRNWRDSFLSRRVEEDPSLASAMGLMYTSLQTVFIVTIVLIGLSNLGVDIGALLAGLGVGGIAVALAAQNILGDLLASLSIVLDKPFVVGDFIVSGSEAGTIENIGIKTTRLRSISGEELIFSNKDLLDSRVRNYKRMWQRRVVQKFGIVYATRPELLEAIPLWIKDIVEKYEKVKFERCHFAKYGDSSLDFELVFWVQDPEYVVFMDFQQKILIDIFRKFAAEKIDFAFPTQSLYIEKMPAR